MNSVVSPPPRFQVTEYHGIWRVSLDGRFFGDFRTRDLAEACIAKSKRLTGGGR